MKQRIATISISSMAFFGSANLALADFYFHPWENHPSVPRLLNVGGALSYYTTQENFDALGNSQIPAGFLKYTRYIGDVSATYGVAPKLGVFGRISWARVSLDHQTRPGSAFGLGDQTLGGNYRVYEKKSAASIDLQLQIDFPAYNNKNAENNLSPYLGDGSTDATFGGFLTLPFSKFLAVGGLGYTFRTADFSSALPWSVQFKLQSPGPGVFANLGLVGFQSLKTDPNADNPPLEKSLGTGGSFVTNAINPSLGQVKGQIGYRMPDGLAFSLGAAKSIWGQASPNGLAVFLGIEGRWGNSPRSSNEESDTPRTGSRKSELQYSLDARVLKSNDRLNLVKIDKGSRDGVEVGEVFDLYRLEADGSLKERIARASVTNVRSDESALQITEYFKEVLIDEGFMARRLVQSSEANP